MAIAASAGVTFWITIVALTLASQQFGPRLLRNFLHDLGNQVVLGTFVRTVRGSDAEEFVPHLAVTVGVVLAMLSLGLSPGTNDPGTARLCLDRLAQALCHLCGRRIPSPARPRKVLTATERAQAARRSRRSSTPHSHVTVCFAWIAASR